MGYVFLINILTHLTQIKDYFCRICCNPVGGKTDSRIFPIGKRIRNQIFFRGHNPSCFCRKSCIQRIGINHPVVKNIRRIFCNRNFLWRLKRISGGRCSSCRNHGNTTAIRAKRNIAAFKFCCQPSSSQIHYIRGLHRLPGCIFYGFSRQIVRLPKIIIPGQKRFPICRRSLTNRNYRRNIFSAFSHIYYIIRRCGRHTVIIYYHCLIFG